MVPPKDRKKKSTRMLAKKDKELINRSGDKAKKKWSEGKVPDKHNNLVPFDKAMTNCRDIPNYKL